MEETVNTKEIEKLFNAGAHLGHKKNRLHPKARKYVYKMVNGVAIIDLTKTVTQIHKAQEFLKNASKEGKSLLVVGTKRVVSQYLQEWCKTNNVPFATIKWMPGLLTNFETLSKNIKKMNDLEEAKQNGTWDKFVKHERTRMLRELNRLKRLYGGLSALKKKPDILFIVDVKREKNALKEAKQNKIAVVAVTDTNTNPDVIDYPIVANDDSPSAAQYVIGEILSAYENTTNKKNESQSQKTSENSQQPVIQPEEPKKKKRTKVTKPKSESK